jgi:hypothetical protein
MSKEEKEAIVDLRNNIQFGLIGNGTSLITNETAGILLNLIEKQNNRLEQLEKENEFWKEYKEKLDKLDTKDFIFKHELENYIPKSVIREKIEELEKLEKGFNFTGLITECETKIEVLNELLGGSNE